MARAARGAGGASRPAPRSGSALVFLLALGLRLGLIALLGPQHLEALALAAVVAGALVLRRVTAALALARVDALAFHLPAGGLALVVVGLGRARREQQSRSGRQRGELPLHSILPRVGGSLATRLNSVRTP